MSMASASAFTHAYVYSVFPQTQKGCVWGNILYEHNWINAEAEAINVDSNTAMHFFMGRGQKSIWDFMLDDFCSL